MAAIACLLACACGSSSARRAQARHPQPTAAATGSTSASVPRTPPPKPVPAAGSLPQTGQLPSGSTATFRQEMAVLWRAIQTNQPTAATPSFFPEAAYAQVKAIADPAADFQDRLLHEFTLDVGAAHQLVGPGAQLTGVDVPEANAHWVPPGACYNRVGYYEVPNSRLVYTDGGLTRSFGIASMISWRGVWYVVHLGAVVRSADTGVVDDPGTGAGVAAPAATC